MTGIMKKNSILILALFVACLATICNTEKDDDDRPPHSPCGPPLCMGFNDKIEYILSEKAIAFRHKLGDDGNCGIAKGYHCGDKMEPPPKDDEKMEDNNTNRTMDNSTDSEERDEKEPPKFIGQTAIESHGGVVCKTASIATMVGWFGLHRVQSQAPLKNGAGNVVQFKGKVNVTACDGKEEVMKNSNASADESRGVKVTYFQGKVIFPGVSDNSEAVLNVHVRILLEDGNYTYEGETVEMKKDSVRVTFEMPDFKNWFCDDSSCAELAELKFRVEVGKPMNPASKSTTESFCLKDRTHICKKSAELESGVEVGILLLANDNGAIATLPEADVDVGVNNSVSILRKNLLNTFSFDYLIVPSTLGDSTYVPDSDGSKPGGGNGGSTSKAAILISSMVSTVSPLIMAILLSVRT